MNLIVFQCVCIVFFQAALPQGIVPFVFAKEYNVHPDILSTGFEHSFFYLNNLISFCHFIIVHQHVIMSYQVIPTNFFGCLFCAGLYSEC